MGVLTSQKSRCISSRRIACQNFTSKISRTFVAMASIIRQNYSERCEALINKQINMEFHASYVYMAMGYYFERDDVALSGFAKFFKKASGEEREHGTRFMEYQNVRGGRIVLKPIDAPTKQSWDSAVEAMQDAIELEKTVNQSLLLLHAGAGEDGDPHLCDFLETHYLDEQVKAAKELSDLLTKMKRAGDSVGLHIIDKELEEK